MHYYDEQLKQLQSQLASKKHLEAVLKELYKQCDTLIFRVQELETKKLAEQADVEHLEGRSLAAFFYNVVGKMDDKLTKERQEAYEASVKYDVAYRELRSVEADIQFRQMELEKVNNSEQQYKAVMNAKLAALKEADIPEVAELLKLEEQIAWIAAQEKELAEAILAGQEAQKVTESILDSLSDAEDWGVWDMFGGGLVADIAKHGHLDDAQEKVEELQEALRCFKTELADIDIQADMQVTIDGLLLFADYFFDGLFADWAVMDSIHESKSQVQKTQEQIQVVLGKIADMRNKLERERETTKAKLDEMIIKASL